MHNDHVIYIAGPMRGYPEFNFPAFFDASTILEELGWDTRNPASHDLMTGVVSTDDPGYLTGDVGGLPRFSMREALRWDTEQITLAEAIALLPGWQHSSGAKAELTLARLLGLRIGYVDLDRRSITFEDEEHDELPCGHGPRYDDHGLHQRLSGLYNRPVVATMPTDYRPTDDTYVGSNLLVSGCGEVRVVDPVTGGAKGSKLTRWDLLPYDALDEVAQHFGRGARKYEDRNWEKGYAWGLSVAAMQRHLAQFMQGEDYDQGDEATGSFPHLAAVTFHALVLLSFWLRGAGTDDRSNP